MFANVYDASVTPYSESPSRSSVIVGSAVMTDVDSNATSVTPRIRPIASNRWLAVSGVRGAASTPVLSLKPVTQTGDAGATRAQGRVRSMVSAMSSSCGSV